MGLNVVFIIIIYVNSFFPLTGCVEFQSPPTAAVLSQLAEYGLPQLKQFCDNIANGASSVENSNITQSLNGGMSKVLKKYFLNGKRYADVIFCFKGG